ncbi:MAG: hypothetical protein IJ748_04950 [Bacteroidales bacterium]|nr:hypothetical protein [Bacteroidales bacterium]
MKKATNKNTATSSKKRLIVSYKNLPETDMNLFNTQYAEGYMDFIQKIERPDGTPMFLVPLETEEIMYMVKVDVRVDEHLSEEDFDKEVFDSKSTDDLDSLDSGKDTKAFELIHGDYSKEDKLIEEQANKDMSEEDSMTLDEIDIMDPDTMD